MNDRFSKLFRVFITTFVFGFYIALVFFSFRQNWKFLLTSEYWIDTITATALALMFRWLYSDSGVFKELEENEKISGKEKEKGNSIAKVFENNLVDNLETAINKRNKENKVLEYRTICDKHINYLREKGWYKLFRKQRLEKWKKRKDDSYNADFNIDTISINYYRYDLDEMLSTFYKQPNGERRRRTNKNEYVISSLKTNIITLLALMIYNALDIFSKDFSAESLVVLFGKLIIFCVNIYTGFDLGKKFIKNEYSSNLSDDISFLRGFLKTEGVN